MGSPENGVINGGLMPLSLLESASLGASLDDNSALTELQKALKSSSLGSDPINSELGKSSLSNSPASIGDNQQSNPNQTANYTPSNGIFDNGLSITQPVAAKTTPLLKTSNNNQKSVTTQSVDSLTGNTANASLLGINNPTTQISANSASAPLTVQTQQSTSQTSSLPFAIRTDGTISINGGGDFDGVPTDLTDDALIYAAKGFTINGNPTLPVQRNAQGNPIPDANGKLILIDRAVTVASGYTTINGTNNQYANLIPPQVVAQQTITVPAYADIKLVELNRRIPAGTPTVTFNISQNPINNANDWTNKFPPPGTTSNPKVVRVIGGGLNVPANVSLSNYVITVDQGDINFNGNGQNFNNVVLIANNGNINLSNVQSRDLSVFASSSINMNAGARFAGYTTIANGSSGGNITFNGATTTTNTSDNLKVISAGDITYNGASDTRGLFLSVKNFTFNGSSTLYGSISAKGNIIFNGLATVIGVAELMPDITPPVITATLARDTAPKGQTNKDFITFDATITGTVTDANPILEFRASFNNTPSANYTNVTAQSNSDGSFSFSRSQLETINGGTLSDGVYTLHLQAKDLYGNLSDTFNLTFTLDTTTPSPNNLDLRAIDDSGSSNTDNITNKNTPSITGNAEIGAVVQLLNNGQVLGTSTTDNTGTWQIATSKLTDGTYNLNAVANDIAGNASPLSNQIQVIIDTTAPIPPSNLKLAPATDTGISNSDNITKNSTPTISGNAEALSTVQLFGDGHLVGQTTVTANGTWQIQVGALSDGQHILTATATDSAGNVSVQSNQLTVIVDTQIASPTNLNLLASNDSGSSNSDKITNILTPTISGNAEALAAVQLFSDGQLVGQTQVTANNTWQVATTTLSNGIHHLTAIATDVAGNISSSSSPLSITIDNALPQLTLNTPVDASPLTQLARINGKVDGTGSEIASLFYYFDNLASIPISLTSAVSFDQQLDFSGISNGVHKLTISATDVAGNVKATQYNVTVALDHNPPVITAKLARDTAPGGTNTDGITFDPTITGRVTDASQVTQFSAGFDSTNVANFTNVLAQRNPDGSFTFNRTQLEQIYGGILLDGNHTLHLQALDQWGNISSIFDVAFSLDTSTAAPTLNLAASSDSGISNSDRITNFTTPTITGNAESGTSVQLFSDGNLVGQGTTTANGIWQISTSQLTDGMHQLNATITDVAGNVSTGVSPLQVTFDSKQPEFSFTTPVNQSRLIPVSKLTGKVDGTGSAVTSLSYGFDNQAVVPLNFNANGRFDQALDLTGLSNGEHTLTIAATDTAGNIKTIQYTVTVIIDQDAPVIIASLLHDTAPNGQTNSDRITFDPTISGTVIDASRVVEFKAGFDNTLAASFTNVTTFRNSDGSFTFDRTQLETIYGGSLPDGFHTLHLQAVDEFHNTSNIFNFSFTFDSTTSEPIFNLNTVSDSGIVGDLQTLFDTVTLTGLAEANSTVVLEETGAVTTSDNNGQFSFAHVLLTIGDNSLIARSTDIAGNQNTFSTNIYRFSPPTAINLTGNIVAENSSTGIVIGQLTSTDPDPGDTHTYTLEDNAGGRFRIVGNQLQVANSTLLNFESSTQHSVTVTSTDANGLSLTQVFAIAVTNVNEAPSFTSTPISTSNSGSLYTYNIVAADPDAIESLRITTNNLPSWLTLVDNLNGTAILSGTARDFLSNINSNIHLLVTDASGLTAIQDFTIAPSLYEIEENNFTVFRSLPLTIPATPSILSFQIDPHFDTTGVNSIHDAIDVALVDANGNSLVHTVASSRDAFFNWTEGESTVFGAGASYDATTRTVSLNLTGINPGTNAHLVFRLVNNDGDISTSVRITDFTLINAPNGTQAPVQTDFGTQISQTTAANFNLLTDVSSSIGSEYHRTSFNSDTHLLYADIALRNIGSYSVDSPLIVAVNHISDPTVLIRKEDGFTPDGVPYYDFSKLVGDTKFDPNELTLQRSLVFYNPQGVQFTYDLTVLAQLNAAPIIQTQPNKEIIAGHSYSYDVNATDPNGDSLTYKLLVAPDGMTIDQTTGLIAWNTAASNIGNQTVLVEVGDGRGGVTQQQYSLSVIDAPPNRPPIFTSTPVVDAAINTNYIYQANASDADDDSLTFSLQSAPQGMVVDTNTGVVSWTPTGLQLGTYDVTLAVADGRGGTAQQAFKIQTQAQSGNHAPIITSQPITQFDILRTSTPQVMGGQIEVTSPGLASIHGQEFLDINCNGVWDKTGKFDELIQLAPIGPIVLTRNDDGSTTNLPLGFTFNFFGKNFTDFYINNNGNITFNQPLYEYTASGFPNNLPIVAPFWADVDTRSSDSAEVHIARGTSTRGNPFIQVDWPGVGYYSYRTDKLNDFTLYIEDDPTGDIVTFAYRNMQWTTGDESGGAGGFGGTGAQIGFNAGDGVNFISLGRPSNTDELIPFNNTQYVFKINPTGTPTPFGEPALDGFTVELVDASTGSVVGTQVTHSWDLNGDGKIDPVTEQGLYRFENLLSGTYTVRQVQRDGWLQTSPTPSTYTVTLNGGTNLENLDFGSDKTYFYPVQAIDPDGDPLTYSLLNAPVGATIDAHTGKINWSSQNAGEHDFRILVGDGRGGQAIQDFHLKVVDNAPNTPPTITSSAPIRAVTGETYTYQVKAEDPNYDSLLFDLTLAPSGMTINPSTGVITWTPTDAQIGSQTVILRVQDGRGGQITQDFNLSVVSTSINQPPIFSSTLQTNATVGQLYQYKAIATDPDLDLLNFDLVVKPDGMTIDSASGRIFWIPSAAQIGSFSVVLRVQDEHGGITLQSTEITVTTANTQPIFTSQPKKQAVVNTLYQYRVRAADAEGNGLKQVASRKSQVASKFCDGDLDPDPKRSAYRGRGLKPPKFVNFPLRCSTIRYGYQC